MDPGDFIVGKGQMLGVVVHAWTDDSILLSHVHLHQRSDGIDVRVQGSAAGLAELVKQYGTRIPVSLVLDTPRCVHKVIASTGDRTTILQQAFPNAPLEQLATSVWRTGTAAGASMARKDMVLEILHGFAAHGLRVVCLTIGPWGLLQLRSLLCDEASEWRMGGHLFSFQGEVLTKHVRCHEVVNSIYMLDSEKIAEHHALAFCAALEKLAPPRERDDIDLPEVIIAGGEELARLWYEHGLLVICAIFVLMFGAERITSYHLDGIQQDLKTANRDQAKDMEAIKELSMRIASLEKLGHTIGTQGGEGLALRAARVVATVPVGICLDGLVVDPLLKLPRDREKLTVEAGLIRVQGTCANASQLDQWMETLRKLRGNPTVRLLSYTVDQEDDLPHFELELRP